MSQEIEESGTRVTRGKLRRLSAERELTQAPGTPKKTVSRRVSQLDAIEESGQSPDVEAEYDPLEKLKTRSATASPRSTRSRRAGSVTTDSPAVNKNVAKLKETLEKTPKRTRRISALTEENVALLEKDSEQNLQVDVSKSVGRTTRRRQSTEDQPVTTPSSVPVRRSTRRNSMTSDDASVKSAPPVTPKLPKRTTRKSVAAILEDEDENSNSKNSSLSETSLDVKDKQQDNIKLNDSNKDMANKSLEIDDSPKPEKPMELKVQLKDINKDRKLDEIDDNLKGKASLIVEKSMELCVQLEDIDNNKIIDETNKKAENSEKQNSPIAEKSMELKIQLKDIDKDNKSGEINDKSEVTPLPSDEKSMELTVQQDAKINLNNDSTISNTAEGLLEVKVQLQDCNKDGMKVNETIETPPSKHEMSKNVTFDGNEKGDSSSNYPKTPKSAMKTRKSVKDNSSDDIFEVSEENVDDCSLEYIVKDVQDNLNKDMSVCIFDTPKVDKSSHLKKLQEKSVPSSTPMLKKNDELDGDEKKLVENLPVSPKIDMLSKSTVLEEIEKVSTDEINEHKFSKSWSQSVKKSVNEGEVIDPYVVKQNIEEEIFTGKVDKDDLSGVSQSQDSKISGNVDDDEDNESKNSFIDDEAIEAPEGYESGDSMDSEERQCMKDNELPVDSISLGSEDEEVEEEDDGSDLDSFIASDEPLELMSSEDEVEKKSKKTDLKKKMKRIIKLDSSTDEEEDDKTKVTALIPDKLEEIDLVTEESDDNVVKMATNGFHVTITSTDAESSVFEESKILDNTGKQEPESDDQTKSTDLKLPDVQKTEDDATEEVEKKSIDNSREIGKETVAATSNDDVVEKEKSNEDRKATSESLEKEKNEIEKLSHECKNVVAESVEKDQIVEKLVNEDKKAIVESDEKDKNEIDSSDKEHRTEKIVTEISQISADEVQEVSQSKENSETHIEPDDTTKDKKLLEEKPTVEEEIHESSMETSVDSNSNKKSKKKKFDMSQNWVEEDMEPVESQKTSRKSLPAVLHDITAFSIDKNKRKTIATTETAVLKEKVKSKRKSVATATNEKTDEKSPSKKKKGDVGEVLAHKTIDTLSSNIEMTFDNDKLLAKCNEFLRQKKEKKRENRLIHKKKKEEKKILKEKQKQEESVTATTEEESPELKKKKKKKMKKPNFLLSETDDDQINPVVKALEMKKQAIELKRLRHKERKDLKKLLKVEDSDDDKKKKKKIKKKDTAIDVKENKINEEFTAPERKKALVSAYSVLKANMAENGSDIGVKKKKMFVQEAVSVKNDNKIQMQVEISKKKKNVCDEVLVKKSKLVHAVKEVKQVLEENSPKKVKKSKSRPLPEFDSEDIIHVKSRKSTSLPTFHEAEMTPPKKSKLKVLGKMVSGGFYEEPITPKELRLKKNRGFVEEQATPPPPKGFKVKDILPAEQEYFKPKKETTDKKRKIFIEEPQRGLPKPVWTASGMFDVEDVPNAKIKKRRGDYIPLSKAGTSTDFLVKPLATKKSSKLRIDENICGKNVQNFKKMTIIEKNAHLREAGKRK